MVASLLLAGGSRRRPPLLAPTSLLEASSSDAAERRRGAQRLPLSPSTAARAPSRCCRSAISCSRRRRPATSRCARPTGGPRCRSTPPERSRSTASCTRAARCASTASSTTSGSRSGSSRAPRASRRAARRGRTARGRAAARSGCSAATEHSPAARCRRRPRNSGAIRRNSPTPPTNRRSQVSKLFVRLDTPHTELRLKATFHYIDREGASAYARVDSQFVWAESYTLPPAAEGVNLCGGDAREPPSRSTPSSRTTRPSPISSSARRSTRPPPMRRGA